MGNGDFQGVTNFSIDLDDPKLGRIRIPTIVPGNERLRADIAMGVNRRPTREEVDRAYQYAMDKGQIQSGDAPISPFGSGFDMPGRMLEQPHLFASLGKILGGSWFDNQVAYPEQRKVGILRQLLGK